MRIYIRSTWYAFRACVSVVRGVDVAWLGASWTLGQVFSGNGLCEELDPLKGLRAVVNNYRSFFHDFNPSGNARRYAGYGMVSVSWRMFSVFGTWRNVNKYCGDAHPGARGVVGWQALCGKGTAARPQKAVRGGSQQHRCLSWGSGQVRPQARRSLKVKRLGLSVCFTSFEASISFGQVHTAWRVPVVRPLFASSLYIRWPSHSCMC